MSLVCTREFLPEARQSSVSVRTGLLAGADRDLLHTGSLGLDRAAGRDRRRGDGADTAEKALQGHTFLALFLVNGGTAYEAA